MPTPFQGPPDDVIQYRRPHLKAQATPSGPSSRNAAGVLSFSLSRADIAQERPMGARRIRREQRREDMAQSRRRNGPRKVKERARRQRRMLELIQASKMPYTPAVLSWLSVELDKPSR